MVDDRETVEVWMAALDDPRDGDACSDGEHDRAARFRDPLVAARWLAARHLLRTLVAARIGSTPQAVIFAEGPHGKPHVPGIEFNLSHAGPLAVVALADRPVGVDVELPRRIARPEGLARRLGLDPATLRGVDPAPVLLRAWTRTEALVKATGDGASAGLARVEERLGRTGWRVVDLDLGSMAVGAVASHGRDWAVAGPQWAPR